MHLGNTTEEERERKRERERERERERREEKKGLNTHRTKKTARYNSEKRVFTGCVAAVFWWAMGATRLCPSSSWFLILLAKMPFPIPPSLPAYRPPPVCSALRGPTLFLICSHGPARMQHSWSCIKVNGPDLTLSHSVHMKVCRHTKGER